MSLQNKKILITAGPTWVAIDPVRVISNTASGETGTKLAAVLSRAGAKVTLVLGPGAVITPSKSVRVLRFSFFDELEKTVKKELSENAYDVIVHSAAVSDFKPDKGSKIKISSSLKNVTLKLVQTPKLIDSIRQAAPSALLVGFKFLPNANPAALIAQARKLGKRSKANLIVANTIIRESYKAFVVSPQGIVPEACSKEELVDLLQMYLDAYFSERKTVPVKCTCCSCEK